MVEYAKELLHVNLEDEMKQSYLDYAMSVIVGRALPDVRDGLKPVHRRALYAMHVLNNDYNKPYKKSARIVGDVIGKYHPHGDTAVYDTIVRMAQPFSMRHMLVDGQGNFGSVDGDAPAAMRYTEVRMAKISHDLMADLEKETVDFVPNYDDTEHEPSVFPTRLPNLLINGSSGIAVGMATNIPPHNPSEVIKGCLALIDDPSMSISDLMEYIPGPDFPTAAIINGARGIREAYHTGRGRIHVRARVEIETDEKRGKDIIIVTELPYQVNKARLLEKIAELVKNKKLDGITELRDESDKDGMRMVIELRRGEVADVVLNNLYQQTQMQNVFGINTVALVEGRPRILNLKELIEAFIRHRREVVTRRTMFELRKARARAHILEGLAVSLANIDEVIALIKQSSNPAEAKVGLLEKVWDSSVVTSMLGAAGSDASRPHDLGPEFGMSDAGYRLSPTQAQAILDLRLHRLTGLEQDKIINEYKEILVEINGYLEILSDPDRLLDVIREELNEMLEQYGDERRTEIIANHLDLTLEDLITEEDVVVTLSHAGYAKSQPVSEYSVQRRGGRGKSAANTKQEDFIDKMFVASTHDTILCFSSRGKVYWLKVYEVPQASRGARGRPLVNLLPLEEGERISAILPIREYTDDAYIFMATRNGTVKKTPLKAYSRPRASGIIAVDLRDGDELIGAVVTDGEQQMMLCSSAGKAIRFRESDVRSMGRTAAGVRGIKVLADKGIISLLVASDENLMLSVTEHGYGKCTQVSEFPTKGRGGQGVISIQASERNGNVVSVEMVTSEDEVMVVTSHGMMVRTPVEGISVQGRNTQGVRLMRMNDGETVVGLEQIDSIDDEDVIDLADTGTDDADASDTGTDDAET
ncbi:MAG TPA: DNA gyrase subunit A [Chromatiaceae bacterium]|jgi:DNA gyrase subunit A|nr:DNA gyrase subunit A [Chromatiaceae bacterium]HIA07539.1 DNA gyrase subunit A [Chromatiaceae bacterium]HIN81404.1 DNA gyrase subunit A [Chromatiales bacterium]HIO55176.1 DNA gyrase subunit A [Chromatiales bacterium]